MRKKLLTVLLLLSFMLLLAACGAETEVAVITASGDDQVMTGSELNNLSGELALYGLDGSVTYAEAQECLFKKDGTVEVTSQAESEPIELIGVWCEPGRLVTAVADEVLETQEPVLVILLDGFGYDSYQMAKEKGLLPFLSTFKEERVGTCYPSISPVGLAAIVSGKTPALNGIKGRNDHLPVVETIFDQRENSFIVEGDGQIIQLTGDIEFNPDLDQDGDTDNEVLACALANLDHDLLFVHFHGIDDVQHAYAPYSKEAFAKIAATDHMVEQLAADWSGRILIVADHGQHEQDEETATGEYAGKKGGHGDFRASDILVPLLIREAN